MKPFILVTLIPALVLTSFAQEKEKAPFMIKAAFVPKGEDAKPFVGAVVAANSAQIEYRDPVDSETTTVSNIKDFELIFFMEPTEYVAAMDLYEAGKFEDAKAQFKKYKDQTKAVANLPGNYHVLAAFQELECFRQLGDLKSLTEALATFPKAQLTREFQLRQLELYVLWDAVKSESWDRVLTVVAEREKQKMPDSQLVQVYYCKGLALEKLNRHDEAIEAYNLAMTADAATSVGLVSKSALAALGLYHKNPAVQEAITLWGAEDEKKGSPGYNKLLEAGALARFYHGYFTHIKEIPGEYKKLMDFKAKQDPEAIKE
jgi:tetratricopeptide (TPR) repeat protein